MMLTLKVMNVVFDETVDTHAPYCYASRNEQRSKNKPLLTKGILTSIAKKYTENGYTIKEYKTYRNKLTHLKEILK